MTPRHRRPRLLAAAALVAACGRPGRAGPPTTGPADPVVGSVLAAAATLENARLRVTCDLTRGTYDVLDRAAGRVALAGATERVGDWASTDAGSDRSAEVQPARDAVGTGRRLLVRSRRPGGPALLLELTLYDGQPFLAVRGGLDNVTGGAVRVTGLHPLADAAVFAGRPWSAVRTLDGMSAAHPSRVGRDPLLSSANDLLLSVEQDGVRRSLVLGALATEDFTKWAHTLGPGGTDGRAREIAADFPGARLVSHLDCGRLDTSRPAGPVHLRAVAGEPFTYGLQPADARFDTELFDDDRVIIEGDGLDPRKRYALGWLWWDYDGRGRVQTVTVGDPGTERPLVARRPLPAGRDRRPPEQLAVPLPPASYRDGRLRARFDRDAAANAVLTEVWLLELPPGGTVPAAWAAGRPVSAVAPPAPADAPVTADLEAFDPVGRLVTAGERYLPADSFYVGVATPDPFDALEQYGRALARATGARPNPYDFPTTCGWYAGVWRTPAAAQDRPWKSTYQLDTTAGLVEEVRRLGERGVLKYSRVAVRLVPDTYRADNPQGWWDDAHWRAGGYYVAPYDTSQAFGHAVQRLGGLAFTYGQLDCNGLRRAGGAGTGAALSADFKRGHRSLLIGDDDRNTLDYTKPQTRRYLASVYAALRGGISGVMFDYCDDFWAADASRGGFADPHATATSFYRLPFRLAKAGLGPASWVHERNLGRPDNDLTLGLVDLQRTSADTDRIAPDVVSRGGLRWYKDRVVIGYDMDAKNLNGGWRVDGYGGTDRDGRRMLLTMVYTAASRLLLANSVRDLDDAAVHDLERVLPFPTTGGSARPVDAFVADGWPRVYDRPIDRDWHELTLYNNALPTRPQTITVPLAGQPVDGGLGLDSAADYYAYDFWNGRFAGRIPAGRPLVQTLRPGEARVLSVHKALGHPQFLSTDRHVMQGDLDLTVRPAWDEATRTLRGTSAVVGGEPYRIVLATNGRRVSGCSAAAAAATVGPADEEPGLATLVLTSPVNVDARWEVRFE